MLVELGNRAAKDAVTGEDVSGDGDRVTYFHIPDEAYPLELGANAHDVAIELLSAANGITRLPGLEPLLALIHRDGAWSAHSNDRPTWVRVSHVSDDGQAREFERLVAELFGAEVLPHGDLAVEQMIEDTHHTSNGMPGVGFDPLGHVSALKTNAGNDIQAWQMHNAGQVLGQTGTATAISATSLTGGTEAPGGSHASNDAVGMMLIAWSNGAYGLVTANTSGTSPVYTVDRWYTPGSPGGAAATTPGATTGYTLLSGSLPAYFMGLTATATSPASGDTTLAGEITTASGGLIRKICPTAHTAGVAASTLTPVFTANGSDSLPVTIAKIGVSQSMTAGVKQLFQTLLNVTATLSASGDQLTVTESITN